MALWLPMSLKKAMTSKNSETLIWLFLYRGADELTLWRKEVSLFCSTVTNQQSSWAQLRTCTACLWDVWCSGTVPLWIESDTSHARMLRVDVFPSTDMHAHVLRPDVPPLHGSCGSCGSRAYTYRQCAARAISIVLHHSVDTCFSSWKSHWRYGQRTKNLGNVKDRHELLQELWGTTGREFLREL